jgi:uncharacterized spore protein YtfJ
MSTTLDKVAVSPEVGEEQGLKALERLFAAAQPGAVYSEPVTAGNYTVITAGEVSVGGGFGFGRGFGPAPATEGKAPQGEALAGGGGAGGGGGSRGRPVAVISIGPDGVTVKPVVDVTKVILSGLAVPRIAMGIARGLRRSRRNRADKV